MTAETSNTVETQTAWQFPWRVFYSESVGTCFS